jgi:hypothetical protein
MKPITSLLYRVSWDGERFVLFRLLFHGNGLLAAQPGAMGVRRYNTSVLTDIVPHRGPGLFYPPTNRASFPG